VLDDAGDSRLAVVGPATLDAAPRNGETLALSLRPLGGRFAERLPAGMLDYAAEVPTYPDRVVANELADPAEPALEASGVVTTYGGLVGQATDRAARLDADPAARLLVATDDLRTALLDALLVPLAVSGSAVLVRNEIRERRDARIAAERVTAHSE
jgi:uncharacterized protein (TIGR03089 family)